MEASAEAGAAIAHPQPTEETWKVNPNKEGLDYDDCPNPDCGERDVNPYYVAGGDTGRERADGFRMYSCNCGSCWTRTPRVAAERDAERGVRTKFRTGSAEVGRFVSAPSDRFRRNYDQIDWSK